MQPITSPPPKYSAPLSQNHVNSDDETLRTRVSQIAISQLPPSSDNLGKDSPSNLLVATELRLPTPPPSHENLGFEWGPSSSSSELPPLPIDMLKVIRLLVEDFPLYLNDDRAALLLDYIYCIQDKLAPGQYKSISPGETFPYRIEVEKNVFHVRVRRDPIGEGSVKKVYRTDSFPTSRFEEHGIIHTPSKKEERALSVALRVKESFSPQANLLNSTLSPQAPVARLISTAKPKNLAKGKAIATALLYDGPMDECDYTQSTTPVFHLLNNIRTLMQGIAAFHKKGLVHRDIKAANTLAKRHADGSFEIVINDYDSVKKVSTKPHKLFLTLLYASPYIFGDGDDNLIMQKSPTRKGVQSFSSDLYSICRTIEIDLLFNFFEQMGNKFKLETTLLYDLTFYERAGTSELGMFTDEQLRVFWKENRGRVIYSHEEHPMDTIYTLDTYENRRVKFQGFLQHLSQQLAPAEFKALSDTINLTFTVMENAEAMDLRQAMDEFENIIEPLSQVNAEAMELDEVIEALQIIGKPMANEGFDTMELDGEIEALQMFEEPMATEEDEASELDQASELLRSLSQNSNNSSSSHFPRGDDSGTTSRAEPKAKKSLRFSPTELS